jgi:hypothetical protein
MPWMVPPCGTLSAITRMSTVVSVLVSVVLVYLASATVRPVASREWTKTCGPAPNLGLTIGTATLATIYYHVLNQTGHDYQAAVSDTLLSTCAFMLLALLIALGEVIWRRLNVDVGLAARPGE